MKNFKKCIILICATLLISFSATACTTGNNSETQPHTQTVAQPTTQTATQFLSGLSETEEAVRVIKGLTLSESVEEIKEYLTEDSYDVAEELVSFYQGKDYTVTAEKVSTYKEYDVFKSTITEKDKEENAPAYFLLTKQDDRYLLCGNNSILTQFVEDVRCTRCNGNGTVHTGGNTCAICGGTGQQYIPNAYFDAALNMWQGQWQACSGCGGAGHIGGVTNTCTGCAGIGMRFN